MININKHCCNYAIRQPACNATVLDKQYMGKMEQKHIMEDRR